MMGDIMITSGDTQYIGGISLFIALSIYTLLRFNSILL